MQRVTGAIQLVSDFERRLTPVAGFQVVDDDLEMPGGFLREDVVQHRIHFQCRLLLFCGLRRFFYRKYGCIGIAFGECARACHQQTDIAGRLGADLELLDELRNGSRRLQDEIHHRRRPNQRAIDELVEQVFDGPAVLADPFRTDHAATALQGVERAPHGDQGFHVVGRVAPRRQVSLDRGDFLLRFLDEELEKLRIQVLRILRDNGQRHDFGRLRHCRRFLLDRVRLDLRLRQLLRGFGHLAGGNLFEPLADIAQNRQAGFGVVQHVPGIGPAGFHRFHVVLDADDGIREPIGFLLREPGRSAALQRQHDQFADALHDVHGARLVQHQQAGPDAPHQRRHAVEALRRYLRRDTLTDGLLDPREVDDALAHDRLGDLLVIRRILRRHVGLGGCRRILRYRQPDELLVQPVLNTQQRGSDIEHDVVVRGAAVLDDRLEAVDLSVDIAAQFAQPEHAESVTDLLQELELRHEFGRLVHARADEDIQHVLHPSEIFLDRRRNGLHQLDARCRQGLPRMLHLLIARQQFGEVERRTDLTDALAGRAGPRNVIQQVVQEIVDRVLVERLDALVDDELDLPVRLRQQAF